MGISLDDLRGKNAEELFLTTERALGQLSGATADVVAKDLYGKLGMSMIAFSKDVDTAMDAVSKVPKVSSEANKALADLGDAAERSKTSFMHWVSEGIGGALVGLDNLHKALDIQGGNQLKVFAAGWQDWFQTLITGTPHAEHLATVFDELNRKQATDIQLTNEGKNAHKDAGAALVTHADALKYMDTLQSQSGKALTDWQTTMLEQLQAMNQLDAAHAAGIGVTVQQLDHYKAGLEAAKKASDDLAKAQAEADKIALDQYTKRIKQLEAITQANLKAYSFDGQIAQLNLLIAAEEATARAVYDQITSEKDRMKIIEDLAVKRTAIATQMMALEQKHAGVVNEQVIAELEAQGENRARRTGATSTARSRSKRRNRNSRSRSTHCTEKTGGHQPVQPGATADGSVPERSGGRNRRRAAGHRGRRRAHVGTETTNAVGRGPPRAVRPPW